MRSTKNTSQTHFEERPYFDTDLDALEKIEEEAGDANWSRPQIRYFTRHLAMDTRIIMTLDSESPIGFYVVEHGDGSLYLSNLAVSSDWRRKGVAMFALLSIDKLGRGLNYNEISLDVQEQNLAAQLLYRKAGFRVQKICHNHYASGQDGYRMVKKLRSN